MWKFFLAFSLLCWALGVGVCGLGTWKSLVAEASTTFGEVVGALPEEAGSWNG